MKICYILSSVSNCGGTEHICLNIASALSSHFDVHVLSLSGDPLPYFEYDKRVRIHRLQPSFIEHLSEKHPKLIIVQLRAFFVFHGFDVIIDTFMMNSNLTIPSIQGLGVRHLVWSNFSFEYFRRVSHEQVALKRIIDAKSELLVLTKGDYQAFVDQCQFPANRIHQIYNPLTVEVSGYTPHTAKKILSVGRFAEEKGFDLLIRAWKIVEQQIPDWRLEIWGDIGIDTGNVWKTFQAERPSRLTLHPATKNIREKYIDASIYVMSSRHEGFPLVLLESLAYSLPIISFDCPNGPREIVKDGYNGILVPSEDVNALSKALIEIILNDELRYKMSLNSFERSKDFLSSQIIPQWIDLLEKEDQ